MAAPCDMPSSANRSRPSSSTTDSKIDDHRLEGEVRDVTVREAGASLVVADEHPVARQLGQEVAPDRAVPVELEVAQPVGRTDERRPLTGPRERDPDAVGRGEDAYLLVWSVDTSVRPRQAAATTARAPSPWSAMRTAYVHRATATTSSRPRIGCWTGWCVARRRHHRPRGTPPTTGGGSATGGTPTMADHRDRPDADTGRAGERPRRRASPSSASFCSAASTRWPCGSSTPSSRRSGVRRSASASRRWSCWSWSGSPGRPLPRGGR